MRGLAGVYEKAGELKRAETYFAEVVELEPQNPISHWDLGIVYEKQGKRESAAETYERALSLGANLSTAFRDELRNRVDKLRSCRN